MGHTSVTSTGDGCREAAFRCYPATAVGAGKGPLARLVLVILVPFGPAFGAWSIRSVCWLGWSAAWLLPTGCLALSLRASLESDFTRKPAVNPCPPPLVGDAYFPTVINIQAVKVHSTLVFAPVVPPLTSHPGCGTAAHVDTVTLRSARPGRPIDMS